VDTIVFGALATSMLTPIESPVRDYLRSQLEFVAYAHRMLVRFFPDFATITYSADWHPEKSSPVEVGI
jgi:hypothetical protein